MSYSLPINLEVNREYYIPISIQQSDVGYPLNFRILNGGVAFNLTGKTVRIKATKPDKTIIYNDVDIVSATDGTCKFDVTTQFSAVDGAMDVQLDITEGTKILNTIVFKIYVKKSINVDTAAESSNEFTALTLALAKVSEWNTYFQSASGALEEKYAARLNGFQEELQGDTTEVTISDSVNKISDVINGSYMLKKIYGKTIQDETDLSIKSVESVELKSTGKNIFDGELENGYIDAKTGALLSNDTRTRSKNYIKVQPNKEYTAALKSLGSDSCFWVIGYDKNKNAITDGLDTYPAGISYFKGPLVSKSFTTTPTTVYLKVCCLGILTKDDDVQIEIGTVATTYEDYKESVQDILFSTPLRSLPSGVRDILDCKTKERTTKIGKKVYNGSSNESFTVYTGGENSTTICFYTSLSEKKIHSPLSNLHLICNRFKSVSDAWSNDRTTECISETTGYSTIYIRVNISKLTGYASTLTDTEKIALFKTWLSTNPVTLLYELATPTTDYVDTNPFIPSYKDGFLNISGEAIPSIDIQYSKTLGASIKTLHENMDYIKNGFFLKKHDFKNFECRNVLDISAYKDNRAFQGVFKVGDNYVALFSETTVGSTTYNAQIVKLDSDYNYVSKTVVSQMSHANDLAYNPSKGEIYIAPMTTTGAVIILNSETLAYKSTKVVLPTTHTVYNISFDRKSQQFAIISGVSGVNDYFVTITDVDFNIIREFTYPIPQVTTTSWCQGMEFIDGLIYFCYSFLSPNGSNNFTRQGYTIVDMNGKILETVLLPDILQPSEEIESIQIDGGHVFISTYTSSNVMLYEAEEGYSFSYLPKVKEATFYYNESNTKKNRDGSQSNPFSSIDEMFIKIQYVPSISLEIQSNITKPITIQPPALLKRLEIKGNSHECTVQLNINRIPNLSVLGLAGKVSTNNGSCLSLLLVQYAYIYQCSFTKVGSPTGTKGVKVQGGSCVVDSCGFAGVESGVSLQTASASISGCSGTASILAYVGSCSMVSGFNNTVTYTTKCYNEGGFENLQ